MKLAYHGATHMPSDLTTDVLASERAGFRALEVWAAKVDRYLEDHSSRELARLFSDHGLEVVSINSIEFIGFRGGQYHEIQARCSALCSIAEIIGCRTLVVVPSPTPRLAGSAVMSIGIPWESVVDEYVTVL